MTQRLRSKTSISGQNTVTRAGNNNFHSKSPTANGLITGLLTFSLTVHVKSTREQTLQHNVSPLYILYYAYISYSLLAITVLPLVRVSHSNITVIHFSSRTLARAITLSISLQYTCTHFVSFYLREVDGRSRHYPIPYLLIKYYILISLLRRN